VKQIIGLTLAVIVLQIGFAPPSQAIFGLSQCEKMWSAIDAEEDIGYALWQRFKAQAARVDAIQQPTQRIWASVASSIAPVYESDIKVYKIAIQNPECFSAKSSADIRMNLQDAKQNLASAQALMRKKSFLPDNVSFQKPKIKWIDIYSRFARLHDWAK
jgi:hypothetical protein